MKNASAKGCESAIFVGEATAGVVHDISNIIQAILLRADYLSGAPELSEKNRNKMELILEDARFIGEILHSILDNGRETMSAMQVDLSGIALESAGEAGIVLETAEGPITAMVEPELARDLFSLVISEIKRGAGPQTRITMSLRQVSHKDVESLAPPWMAPKSWLLAEFSREGEGDDFGIDEELHLSRGPVDKINFNILRIRGLVKLHSGFFKISREEPAGKKSLSFKTYLPS